MIQALYIMQDEDELFYLELLKKHLNGTLTAEEREVLRTLEKDDSNKVFFSKYMQVHQMNENAKLRAEIIYEKTKPNDLNQIISPAKPRILSPKTRRHYRYIVAAACLIFFLSSIFFIHKRYRDAEENAEWEQIVTNKGERKFFHMNDGTEIWLNSESVLRVKKGYGVKHRILDLKGEAYFSVAKNKKLPLHVHALGNEIEVLGTVFNVKAYPEERKMETSLIEGSVKLHVNGAQGKKDYELNPGDKVEITNKKIVEQYTNASLKKNTESAQIVIEDVDYKKISVDNKEVLELMWTKNKLVFNNDALETVVKKMERWYNRTIVIQSDSIKAESFSGVFKERNCEQVLDLLKQTGGKFDYKVENGIIYLK